MAIPEEMLARARAAAARLAAELPGVELIALFGSVARAEPRGDSDVDLAVLGADFWPALRIGSELGRRHHRQQR